MFPTKATIRAAKRDRVAGVQQQLPTSKVVSDCYNKLNRQWNNTVSTRKILIIYMMVVLVKHSVLKVCLQMVLKSDISLTWLWECSHVTSAVQVRSWFYHIWYGDHNIIALLVILNFDADCLTYLLAIFCAQMEFALGTLFILFCQYHIISQTVNRRIFGPKRDEVTG
jgi:hypothetical protein